MQAIAFAQKKSLELKKHVGLIHSTNRLTLLERKIANALLYNAYEYLPTQSEHKIHIPSLCALIGYNSKDYKTIKQSLISLISTVLEWNLIDKDKDEESGEGGGVWMASSMLADAKIDGPMCTYSYSNRMRELCHYPEIYGRLNMSVLSMFKSTYGLALYENCIRYQNITQTPWFDLPTYRKLMGVEDGKYGVFRDLNKRVVKPSVKEVNEHSPIRVESELRKHGRSVLAIRFLIKKRTAPITLNQIKHRDCIKSINDRLKEDYGLSALQQETILTKYEEGYILEKMKIIESSLSYQNGKIGNLAKYLEKGLGEDFQPPASSKANLEKLKAQRKKGVEIRKTEQEKRQAYRVYQNEQLPDLINGLSERKKRLIKNDFDKYLSKTLYYKVYVKEGLGDPLVRDRFGDFIRANYTELLTSLVSFDVFYKYGVSMKAERDD